MTASEPLTGSGLQTAGARGTENANTTVVFGREWAMPNKATFSIPPVARFLDRWLPSDGVIVDPFSGTSERANLRNDLAVDGLDAIAFLDVLVAKGVVADAVLLDPPYSPRQMSEAYKNAGLPVRMTDTQNARLYREAKGRLAKILKLGGVALTFGWNSAGFGRALGFEQREILLVAHGGAHNDTICVAEIKIYASPSLPPGETRGFAGDG